MMVLNEFDYGGDCQRDDFELLEDVWIVCKICYEDCCDVDVCGEQCYQLYWCDGVFVVVVCECGWVYGVVEGVFEWYCDVVDVGCDVVVQVDQCVVGWYWWYGECQFFDMMVELCVFVFVQV